MSNKSLVFMIVHFYVIVVNICYTQNHHVTGRHLCTLPVDPNIGKMLLIGAIFQCVNPALTIAAALAYRSPFVLPLNRKEEADEAKRYFAGDSCRYGLEANYFIFTQLVNQFPVINFLQKRLAFLCCAVITLLFLRHMRDIGMQSVVEAKKIFVGKTFFPL